METMDIANPSEEQVSPSSSATVRGAGMLTVDAILALIIRHLSVVFASFVLALAVFLVSVLLIPKQYTASMTVAAVPDPVQGLLSQAGGGMASAVARLKGLGGFGGEGDERLNQYIALLTSEQVARTLAAEPWVAHGAFRNEWDVQTHAWKKPGMLRQLADFLKTTAGYPAWRVPDGQRLARVLQKDVKTDQDLQTGFVTIKYSNEDGDFAVHLLQALNATTDKVVRTQSVETSKRRIRFLNDRLNNEEKADLRLGLIDTISTEEHSLAIASSDPNYSALVVVAPNKDERPSSPSLMLLAGLSLAIGGGAFYLFLLWEGNGRPLFRSKADKR